MREEEHQDNNELDIDGCLSPVVIISIGGCLSPVVIISAATCATYTTAINSKRRGYLLSDHIHRNEDTCAVTKQMAGIIGKSAGWSDESD